MIGNILLILKVCSKKTGDNIISLSFGVCKLDETVRITGVSGLSVKAEFNAAFGSSCSETRKNGFGLAGELFFVDFALLPRYWRCVWVQLVWVPFDVEGVFAAGVGALETLNGGEETLLADVAPGADSVCDKLEMDD
jgi:hypothetical protein